MKNNKHICLSLLFLLLIGCHSATAYNLRQFSSKDGLSNSAILSICQQRNGLLWFGSCDGLNLFDGLNVKTYPWSNGSNNLSGNLIGTIIEAEDDILWVQTNYGLDRINTKKGTTESFKEFKDANIIAKSRDNDLYVIKEDNYIYYYHSGNNQFQRINIPGLRFAETLQMAVDSKNRLWIFTSDGQCRNFSIERTDKELKLISQKHLKYPKRIRWCSVEEDILYYIDETYSLYEYELLNQQEYYIYDLAPEIKQRGEVSSIIKQHNDYYIAFKSSGLISLKHNPTQKIKYTVADITIKSGIFCLVKDQFQDIIWVGTDGQGVFMHYMDSYSITSIPSGTLSFPVNNPIRALFLDKEQTLWMGTKGDGILRMSNYSPIDNTSTKTEQLLTGNSALLDNSVYCFAPSRKNVLWVGSENGINYYSYRERQMKPLALSTQEGERVKYVHSICELNDTTLWIATVGEGIVKASLAGSADSPIITSAKRIVIDEGSRASNYFFTIYQENDSILWFGNRGKGAYRMNTESEEKQVFRFDEGGNNQTLNDIFTIHKSAEGHWFGTSFGVTYLSNGKKQVFNTHSNFPSNTIHGILEDDRHNLWFSTNRGMVKFNINENTIHTYNRHNEVMVTEFSDGAYFKDEQTGTLFFGGIDGFITIHDNEVTPDEYAPQMQFSNLSIYGKECNIYDFLRVNKGVTLLELHDNQNFFSVSFTALDYVDGNNYTYYYRIDGESKNWVDNGISSTATFTNIAPGTYTLLVKYRNNTTGKESATQSLRIHVLPPWYQTNVAYFLYLLLFAALLLLGMQLSISRYRMKRSKMLDRMNRQQREELYESKLRFFTNITHEFCTPLTLISGPCEKIITYPKADGYVQKYATLIQRNAERLNALIQELIEFRRLETGNKKLLVRSVPVNELMLNIATSFCELAETKSVDYQIKIKEEVRWNSDASCLNKIVTNLISNAFKYTPDEGTISVELFIENQQLHLLVSNSGKGIKEEDLTKVFDRYKILDRFETSSKNNFSPRNGLGLAICHSMVLLLNGDIRVSSIPDETTTFEVILPELPAPTTETEEASDEALVQTLIESVKMPSELESTQLKHDKEKLTIMLIDDDPSMLWFITELFASQYNVISISDPKEVMERLQLNLPDLILSDVMMPDIDGISLTKAIKSNKLLCHIPLILLSARNDVEEQVRGIESGAEIYITKPFNVKYLEKVVARLLKREEELKDYYGSVYSSFQLDDGRFMHKEDKEFFEKMMQVIEQNIANSDLSVETLSALLGYGTRQFYRKLKCITEKTPADIIKEYRLSIVERLLTTTNLSIDEVSYKVGFANRGNFYKIFDQKFGTTPKKYRLQKQQEFKELSEKA